MAVSLIWLGLAIGSLIALVVGWKIGSMILKVISLILIVGVLLSLGLFGFSGM